jgi:hypothetical protein
VSDSPPRNLHELKEQAKDDGPLLASSGVSGQARRSAEAIRQAVAAGGAVHINDDIVKVDSEGVSASPHQFSLVVLDRQGVMVDCFVMVDETNLDRVVLHAVTLDRQPKGTTAWSMAQRKATSAQLAGAAMLHDLLVVQTDMAERFWNYVGTLSRASFAAAHHMGLRATKKMFNRPATRVSSEGTWSA